MAQEESEKLPVIKIEHSSPSFSQLLYRSHGEEACSWYHVYVMDRKWWTWLEHNVNLVFTGVGKYHCIQYMHSKSVTFQDWQ